MGGKDEKMPDPGDVRREAARKRKESIARETARKKAEVAKRAEAARVRADYIRRLQAHVNSGGDPQNVSVSSSMVHTNASRARMNTIIRRAANQSRGSVDPPSQPHPSNQPSQPDSPVRNPVILSEKLTGPDGTIRVVVQCIANAKTGRQCRLRTAKYPDMCHIHTKAKRKLALKESGIPRGGTGLFTLKDIEKGEVICEYTGTRMKQSDYNKTDSAYGVELAGTGKVIDAASTQSNIGRYINDCRSTNKTSHHCPGNNTKFSINHRGRKSITIKAIKKIKKNKELFIGYGRGYWANGKKRKRKSKLKRVQS